MGERPRGHFASRWGLFILAFLLLLTREVSAQNVCAIVKLQISQKATLEREAFNADLDISNNIPNQPLTNLKVQIFINDANGNPADNLFFVAVSSLSGTNAVDGTGVIQSSSSANISWLIIPSTGAGGTLPQGLNYSVSAMMSSVSNGTPQTLNTFPATITVLPQPALDLEYAIPFEVFGEEPLLLPNIVTPIIPFPLAVRVLNVGYGPANNFQIQSAQPEIVDNKQGLAVSFNLLGTNVGGITAPNSLLVNFGNIPPGGAAQASWIMSASLSGQFISFTSTFTHAAALGGQLTSLIQNISNYTLLSQVQVDVPIMDPSPDFLVNTNFDRQSMGALLDSGVQPPANLILESDYQTPIQVTEVPGSISGILGGSSASLNFSFTEAVSSGVWVHSYAPFPYGNSQDGASPAIASAIRSDGKKINPQNVWVSKHFIKSSLKYIFWLNVLDFTSSAATYVINFSSANLDLPPGAVNNLSAQTDATEGGAISLGWTAPGDDGFVGNMLGASYFIESSLSSTTAFAPGAAQIHFATNTIANSTQSYLLSGLVGNATNYLVLWTQDPGGNMSALSNEATAYTLPNPPNSLVISSRTNNALSVNWAIGDNSLPIAYQVLAATAPFGLAVSSSPFLDSFHSSFTFTGLLPGTTYFILGLAENPLTGVSSPLIVLGSTETILPRDIEPPRTSLLISSPSFAGPETIPSSMTFVTSQTTMTLSSIDDLLSTGDAVGLGVALTELQIDQSTPTIFTDTAPGVGKIFVSTFNLAGFSDGLHTLRYFSKDIVGNVEAVHVATVAVDNTPPATSLVFLNGFSHAVSTLTYVSSSSFFSFSAVDPVINGVASGLALTQYRVDPSTFPPTPFEDFISSFSLPPGLHEIDFRSQDNVGNIEPIHQNFVFVDTSPPSINITAPSSGTYAATLSTITVLFSVLDPYDPSPVSTATLVELSHLGGPISGSTEAFVVNGETIAPASLDQGVWELQVTAFDFVHNSSSSAGVPFRVLHDIEPPRTSLLISSPSFAGAGTIPSSMTFVTSQTTMTLSSIDDLLSTGDAVGLGVAFQSLSIDGSTPTIFTDTVPGVGKIFNSTFNLAGYSDGLHVLRYFSEDIVGNVEAVHIATIAVDNTPPVTKLGFSGGTQFSTPSVSGVYASSSSFIVLSATDPIVNGVASGVAFTRYSDNGNAFQIYSSSFALPGGAHLLSDQSQDNVENLEALENTNILVDTSPPVTTISIGSPTYTSPSGTLYVSTEAPISLSAVDPLIPQISTALPAFPGSGVLLTQIALDTNVFSVYSGSFTLAEGIHTILYRSVDEVGNVEATHQIQIESDGTPPVSSLSIGSPQFALSSTTLLVSSITPFVIVSTDPVSNGVASGVKNSFFKVSIGTFAIAGSSFTVYSGSFTLSPPDGSQTISFYSVDEVLNAEVMKSSTVILDSTPPSLALLSPASCEQGICRVLKGKFPVLGSVYDLYLASWTLSFAPGQNAVSGFTQISSGTLAVSSGTLGTWDTTALTGWQTLSLSASDLVQNMSAIQINVFIGDPGELMILGNDDVFNLPEGVAAAESGNIYVADTNADRIEVFSSTGAELTGFGVRPPEFPGEIPPPEPAPNGAPPQDSLGDQDDQVSTMTLTLNKPSGLALDSSGYVYIADTNDDRVVKVSSSGQILLALGKEHSGKDGRVFFSPGSGPGEFNKPSGVAVDSSGNIYVSDTENGRIQIFSSTGSFETAFNLPATPRGENEKDKPPKGPGGRGPDNRQQDIGTPFGIALDGLGRIYVADPKGGRALVFSSTGQILLDIPIATRRKRNEKNPPPSVFPGLSSRERGEPFGIAVSTGGDCLLVSDRKSNRILKFDDLGAQTLKFGKFGQIPDNTKPPQKIVFHKPMGLALDSSGALYVADRDNDRIEKFSLPTATPTIITPPPGPEDDEIARGVVDKDLGGKISRPDFSSVQFSPGALLHDLQVKVSSVTAANLPQLDAMAKAAQTSGLTPAYAPVDFGPEGTVFQASVTLTIPYNPAMLANAGISDDDLKIRWWNPVQQAWQDLDSSVDKTNHLVTAQTGHFSLYQVLAGTSSTRSLNPLSAPTAFQFVDLYAFPNPAKGQFPDIRVQVGLADSVDLHIYDISGRLIKTATLTNPVQLDDGNGKGLQYTFDYLWNTSSIGSGVYIYAITAHKAGYSNISRTKKVAVIR